MRRLMTIFLLHFLLKPFMQMRQMWGTWHIAKSGLTSPVNLAGNPWALTSPSREHLSEVGANLSLITLFGSHPARCVLRQMRGSGGSLATWTSLPGVGLNDSQVRWSYEAQDPCTLHGDSGLRSWDTAPATPMPPWELEQASEGSRVKGEEQWHLLRLLPGPSPEDFKNGSFSLASVTDTWPGVRYAQNTALSNGSGAVKQWLVFSIKKH